MIPLNLIYRCSSLLDLFWFFMDQWKHCDLGRVGWPFFSISSCSLIFLLSCSCCAFISSSLSFSIFSCSCRIFSSWLLCWSIISWKQSKMKEQNFSNEMPLLDDCCSPWGFFDDTMVLLPGLQRDVKDAKPVLWFVALLLLLLAVVCIPQLFSSHLCMRIDTHSSISVEKKPLTESMEPTNKKAKETHRKVHTLFMEPVTSRMEREESKREILPSIFFWSSVSLLSAAKMLLPSAFLLDINLSRISCAWKVKYFLILLLKNPCDTCVQLNPCREQWTYAWNSEKEQTLSKGQNTAQLSAFVLEMCLPKCLCAVPWYRQLPARSSPSCSAGTPRV